MGNAVVATNIKVKIGATDVSGDLNQVKLNLQQAEIDVSTFGSASGIWKDFIPGANEATIDLTAFFNKAAGGLDVTMFGLFGGPSSPSAWELYMPDGVTTGSIKYSGNGWGRSNSPDSKIHDVIKLTAQLRVTGAVTRATVT